MDPQKTKNNKSYNFLVNSSNQANLTGTNNLTATQLNSLFILVHPYYIEKYNFAGLDIDLRIDEKGSVWLNNKEFELMEVMPGVKVFGILKR